MRLGRADRKCPRWLARHPRFHVHFTPTGSSWVNQVERWFGLLTDKLIRRGVHTSVQALENDIKDWIATWNDNPRPFTWTKTADEILSSLADYLAKLGTGHLVNGPNPSWRLTGTLYPSRRAYGRGDAKPRAAFPRAARRAPPAAVRTKPVVACRGSPAV
jgi:DDE superfamily endonuclease